MTQALRNRSTAWIITIVLVVLAILLGGRASLAALRQEALDTFYGGNDGYYSSIEYDLDEIVAASRNLMVVAERYLPENDMMVDTVRKSCDMLEQVSGPRERKAAADKLYSAVDGLGQVLKTQELSDADKTYHDKILAEIESRMGTISNNGYNQAAAEFNAELTRMPAGVLASVTGIKPLELYE